MTWVRIDDAIDEHPKIAALDDSAFALFVASLAYCNRNLTDGFIPTRVGGKLRFCDGDATPAIAQLETAGLWVETPGGWRIHDFHDYQPSKQDVLDDREKKRKAGSLGGKAAAKARATATAQAESKQNASNRSSKFQAQPQAESKPVPVPVPTELKPSATPAGKPTVAKSLTKFFVDEFRKHHPKDPMRIGAIGAWARDALKAGWEEERLREVLADAARAKRYRPAQLQDALEKPSTNGKTNTFDMLRDMHDRETNGKA